MNTHKKLTIGLFGFGVVGDGLYKILQQTPSLQATIKKVCIKHPEKKRDAPLSLFTTDKNELLNDAEINVIVEVIDDSKAAFDIVTTALLNGKAVVSSSKKMIAENLPALLSLQQQSGLSFLYEASACASIPVIRNLEEYYDNDLLHSIKAIVNGSTNFILTRMFEAGIGFAEALQLAQQLGFAESDPKLDIEGYDAVNKWSLLLAHSYGIVVHPENILFTGIQHIQLFDASVAREKQLDIKLVGTAKKLGDGKVAAFLLPQFINHDDHLFFVKNEYNGVVIESGFADQQFFYGKGAGSFPTASAVLSDISALRYDYQYEYKKMYHHQPAELANDFYLQVYVSFTDWKFIQKNKFTRIDEIFENGERKYFTGIIPYTELLASDWWKDNGVSLIACEHAIVESLEQTSIPLKEDS